MRDTGFRSAWRCAPLLLAVACTSSNPGPDGGTPDSGNPVSSCSTGCAAGLQCTTNSDFPTGACTAACTTPGTAGCRSGEVCAPLSTGNYCVQTCVSSASCPDGLVCATTVQGKVCLARGFALGSPTPCPAPTLVVGSTAGPAAPPSTCQTPRVPSSLPASDVQSLGTHQVGTQLSFSVPAGAVGMSLVSQAFAVESPFIVYQGTVLANLPVPSPLLTPSGATFFDDNASLPADPTSALFLVASPAPYTAALTFPGTSAALDVALDGGLPGGEWTLGVNDYAYECLSLGCDDGGTASNTYDVSVIVKPGPLPATGHMDVDIYLVSTTLDAGTAVSNSAVQRFASQYATFYAQAGVCVSTITLHDVPEWAKTQYASLSVDDADLPCGEFRQMFTLAEPGRTMELFLVDELLSGTKLGHGESIVGLDGAIPGPATFNGTIAGGAAVSLADLLTTGGCGSGFSANCGPDLVAYVAGHETGHFLGLYHPSESGGDFFDPLVDTPACVCQLCQATSTAAAICGNNPDGGLASQVLPAICSGSTQECGGGNLLMFWIVDSASVGNISPQQAAVIRANPLIAP